MKQKRYTLIFSVALVLFVIGGSLALFLRVRQYPASSMVTPVADAFLTKKGYTLVVEKSNRVPRVHAPLILRLCGITKIIADDKKRVDLGDRYERGYLARYRAGDGSVIEIEIDTIGQRTYRVSLIGEKQILDSLSELASRIKTMNVPVSLERGS